MLRYKSRQKEHLVQQFDFIPPWHECFLIVMTKDQLANPRRGDWEYELLQEDILPIWSKWMGTWVEEWSNICEVPLQISRMLPAMIQNGIIIVITYHIPW
jgi:hypothetical protein